MSAWRSDRGEVMFTILGIAVLLIGLFEAGRRTVQMVDTAGAHYSGKVEASADRPDWKKVEKGHLRYAQKALAHGVLAGRAVVGAAGSPSQWYDLPSNIDTVAAAARDAWVTNGGSAAAPGLPQGSTEGSESTGLSGSGEQWVCKDGLEWGCDIEVRPGEDSESAASAGDTADGVYGVNVTPFIQSFPAAVTEVDGQIVVDADSWPPVQGQVSVTFEPASGGAQQTDTYDLWSEEPPVLDPSDGSWDVSLYLQRTGTEPYLFAATIETGSLTLESAPFGLDLSFTRR